MNIIYTCLNLKNGIKELLRLYTLIPSSIFISPNESKDIVGVQSSDGVEVLLDFDSEEFGVKAEEFLKALDSFEDSSEVYCISTKFETPYTAFELWRITAVCAEVTLAHEDHPEDGLRARVILIN